MQHTNMMLILLSGITSRRKCSNLAHFPTPSLKNKKKSTLKKIAILFSKKFHHKQISYTFPKYISYRNQLFYTLKHFFSQLINLGQI